MEVDPRVSRVIRAIEDVWRRLAKDYPDVNPNVQVVIGAPSRNNLGHYATATWRNRDGAGDLDELFISGELLIQPPESILKTIIHEAAHSVNSTRGVKDTCRRGTYHNARFAEAAQDMGLITQSRKGQGVFTTGIAESPLKAYAPAVRKLDSAVQAWRKPAIKQARPKASHHGPEAFCSNCDLHGRIPKRMVEAGLRHAVDDGWIVMEAIGTEQAS